MRRTSQSTPSPPGGGVRRDRIATLPRDTCSARTALLFPSSTSARASLPLASRCSPTWTVEGFLRFHSISRGEVFSSG